MNHRYDTEVLIVGGGPVGVSMALELGYRNVDFIVVEAGTLASQPLTVSTLGPRSMELFRRHGLAGAIRAAGLTNDHPLDIAWVSQVGGDELQRTRRGTPAARPVFRHTPEPDAVCPQHRLMPLLARAVGVHPRGPIRFRSRMESLCTAGDGVAAVVRDLTSGQPFTVHARYLVACDGSSSAVRRACGVEAPTLYGTWSFRHILFRASELRERLGERAALCYVLMGPQSSLHIRALDGLGLYRLTTIDDSLGGSADATTLVGNALAVNVPFQVLADRVWGLRPFIADRFRAADHVFLVGDAAHCLPPAGGFGVNTGICGASDLAWKIAAELAGWAGPRLLDSYETERSAVARTASQVAHTNLARTLARKAQSILTAAGGTSEPSPSPEPAESASTPVSTSEVLAHDGIAREFDAPDVHLGFRYRSSQIVRDPTDLAADGRRQRPGPDAFPGCRAPHAWLRPGVSTLDLFGRTFVLLCFPQAGATHPDGSAGIERAFAARSVPLRTIVCANPEIAGIYSRAFVLVRPDGHVAWRGHSLPTDTDKLVATVRGAG